MGDRFDPDTKSKWYSIIGAAIITAIFAVPYFYYQYFYDPAEQAKEARAQSATANVGDPVKSTFGTLKALLKGDLSGESVYQKSE